MAKSMTSRERVQSVFSGSIPDRVPLDYASNPGIDGRLKAHFGLEKDDGEGLLSALEVDFRHLGARYTGPRLHEEVPGVSVDARWGIHRRWVEHGSGGYWDFCDFPLKGADLETVEEWPMPSPDDHDYAAVSEACQRSGDVALVAGGAGIGDIINSTGFLVGMEESLVGLISDDPAVLRLTDRRHEVQLEVLRRTLEAGKGRIDIMHVGEDLGTQKAPMISMDLFKKHIRPRHQQFVDLAKSFDLPVMIHCCGSSSWAFEDFIEMGIDCVDTLQPEAVNMSPAYLKEHFGGRLAFHGAISTAGKVAFGSVEDVKRDVRETLEVMMPGGGYCLAPTHQLQDNSPTENVVAMYETARALGEY